MDVEKLTEQLRYLATTPSFTAFHDAKEQELICEHCKADFCCEKQQDAHWCMYEALSRAAEALEKLQAELEKVKAERDAPVVRCKDCYHTFVDKCGNRWCKRNWGRILVNDDDFCSYGERKEPDNEHRNPSGR